MNLRRLFIFTCFRVPYVYHRATGTGAFGKNRAEYVDGPLPIATANPLKAGLAKHYVKQYHEASCSVASVATAMNAIREAGAVPFTPITQLELLDRVPTANWKKRMSKDGDNGKRGLPLPVLGEVVKGSLAVCDIPYRAVDIVQARKDPAEAKQIKALLRQRLIDFENRGEGIVIAHFDQGRYVPTLNIPHISPVGGFDPETGRVLLLDVDPGQRPYHLSFGTFYEGLAGDHHHLLKPFGFGSGGYIFIDLRR